MSKYQLLALLFGLLLVAAPLSRADEYGDDEDEAEVEKDDEEKDVVVLTDKTFDETIKNAKYALVEFYAPWCGHCKSLKPHYAKAATELKKYDPSIVIAKVDATVETATAQKIGIQGYPTLKWYVDGEASEYNGGRDADAIVKWIKKKTGPFSTTVESPEALVALEKESPVVVFGYFTSFDGDAYEAFKTVGQKSEDVVFAQTTDASVAAAAGTTVAPGIVIIKNFKGESRETANLIGDITAESISALVKSEKLPLTIEFSSENSDKIFNSGISKQLILWTKAADLEPGSAVFEAYRAVSRKFKGQLVFVVVNNEGEGHEPVTNYFGLKEAEPPVVLGFWMEKNKKFRFRAELTEAALSEFAQAVVDGTAEVEYKSAPIPEDDKDGDVQIVVGKTYESIVNDAKKDVLLEVYAPWCGHCKKLDPIYKKLAKRFKKVDSVVIAKMDGTENEHPDLEVKGFPTIVFVPAEEGATPITFSGGDRSLKALTKFIKQHAKVAYELPKKGEDAEEGGKEAAAKDEL